MIQSEIKKFYNTYNEYFKTKNDIYKALLKLSELKEIAQYALNISIDNNFESSYVLKMFDSYLEHKFNSSIVQEFLDKVFHMFFDNIKTEFKEHIEVLSLSIKRGSRICNNDQLISPITISFCDRKTNRYFDLIIPIKCAVYLDIENWKNEHHGMYRIKAYDVKQHDRCKDICYAFDISKASEAIEKYLNGDFDDELCYD